MWFSFLKMDFKAISRKTLINLFFLIICSIASEALENLALGKSASQSWTELDYGASRAVDGITSQSLASNSCAKTKRLPQNQEVWWQVDLMVSSEIKDVTLYYRNDTGDETHMLDGFKIYISTGPSNWKNGTPCYKDTTPGYPSSISNVTCVGYGRYVTISNDHYHEGEAAILELCEVQVFGCKSGTYGWDCRKSCPMTCQDNRCDPYMAHCLKGCIEGWKGEYCMQPCTDNYFGSNCEKFCHCRKGGCNPENGYCYLPGCKAGYKGENCTTACDGNYFGPDCGNTCNCLVGTCSDHKTGICDTPGCKDGWHRENCSTPCSGNVFCNSSCNCKQGGCDIVTGVCVVPGCRVGWKGKGCNETCQLNRFGHNCSTECRCMDGGCNHINGVCFIPGCRAGYTGQNCSLPCGMNTFGPNCNSVCHCEKGECDHMTGTCLVPGCKPGWKRESCSEACEQNKFGTDCSLQCHCLDGGCNNINGVCNVTGCSPGYIGLNCSSPCKNGTFGTNCSSTCNCINGNCNPVDGHCALQGCLSGWQGMSCSQRITDSEGLQSGTIAGIIVAVVIVLLVCLLIVIVVFVLKRRRTQHSQMNDKDFNKNYTLDSTLPKKTTVADNKFKVQAEKDLDYDYSGYKTTENVEPPGTNKDTIDDDNMDVNILERELETEDTYIHSADVDLDELETSNQQHGMPPTYKQQNSETDQDTLIQVKDLGDIIEKFTSTGEFVKQYKKIPHGALYPCNVGKMEKNKIKNRFSKTLPYDHSRVVLTDDHDSDYINASYIDGIKENGAYVATQGPKKNTVDDFWRMVWQVNCGKIVMLNNLFEHFKLKCHQYWPDMSETFFTDVFEIKVKFKKEQLYFITRVFSVRHTGTGEVRRINHFHFTTWPDHGIPDSIQLALFHREYMKSVSDLTGPPVIHCSAGIGRTGTFIGLDALYRYGLQTGHINVFDFVKDMRKNRMNMVQTKDQYIVLHEVLLEAFEYQDTSLDRETFSILMEENFTEEIEKEFQTLMKKIPKCNNNDLYNGAKDKKNEDKNRTQNILPVDKYRPYLMSHDQSRTNYINAVIIPGIKDSIGFLVTQCPLPDTVSDLWCMVYDHHSSTVVCLDDSPSIEEVCWMPRDGKERIEVDSFTLHQNTDPKIVGDVKENELILKHHENVRRVMVHQYMKWTTGCSVPSSIDGLLRLIKRVQNWRSNGGSGPITVICLDGANCCGVFCLLYNIIQGLNFEDNIDIYHTARQLQKRRPEFLTTKDQYEFCYQAVQKYIENEKQYI